LFVDVSVISENDAGTGIQRTVRAVVALLLSESPPGWTVIPVAATRKCPYRRVLWPTSAIANCGDRILPVSGDVFLGLDFSLDAVYRHRRQLASFRRQGCKVWFVMYDLLPIQRPDWFSDRLVVRFANWLWSTACVADGFFCISSIVERHLREQLSRRYSLTAGFSTRVLPMGADLSSARHGRGMPEGFEALICQLKEERIALMVGTVEPRKGHADVLKAFERLWAHGRKYRLVVVGRPGWKNHELITALETHALQGSLLFWLKDVSDDALQKLYEACDGVIIASHAEGFGLPLVEALGHGKRILARDLEVFRVHAGFGITYFAPDSSELLLAQSIEDWLESPVGRAVPTLRDLPSWSDTADCIIWALNECPATDCAGGLGSSTHREQLLKPDQHERSY